MGRVKINDPQSLRNPRPDTSLAESRGLFGFNPVWNELQFMQLKLELLLSNNIGVKMAMKKKAMLKAALLRRWLAAQ